jgi:hypothetical protein
MYTKNLNKLEQCIHRVFLKYGIEYGWKRYEVRSLVHDMVRENQFNWDDDEVGKRIVNYTTPTEAGIP